MANEKRVDRHTLYEEVWTDPVTVVAPRYGLSDVGLAKICRSLAIPLPSRGYWTKVRAGKVIKKIPLPQPDEWKTLNTRLTKLSPDLVQARTVARENSIRIRKKIDARHPFIDSSLRHPMVQAASRRLHQKDGWPKNTSLRHLPAEVLDIAATPASLDRALQITDALFRAFKEHSITIEVDPVCSSTVLTVNKIGVQMTFCVTEYVRRTTHEITSAEERARKQYIEKIRKGLQAEYPSIPQYDYHPTGLITIKIGNWPSKTWRDTSKTKLEKRLGEIVVDMLILANEIYVKKQEDIRREEERRCAAEKYDYFIKLHEIETAKFEKLKSDAANWERAEKLRQFADAVEQAKSAAGLLNHEINEWLAWARAKADFLDPLIDVSDLVLSLPAPNKYGNY